MNKNKKFVTPPLWPPTTCHILGGTIDGSVFSVVDMQYQPLREAHRLHKRIQSDFIVKVREYSTTGEALYTLRSRAGCYNF
jgi:hypothetical protein